MKKLTICIAAAAILAVPASAGAADKFYGGKIDNGGKIGIDVTLQGGKPFQILAMRYATFPANCDGTPSTIGGTWSFTNGFVVNNRFDLSGSDGGSQLFFKGEFKRGGRKIEGKIKEGPSEFPGAICTSAKRNYDAKRGGNGPHPQPKAKIHRAFRVAG